MPEGAAISRMFAGIAGRYDTANHLLSFGQDYRWRRKLAAMVKARDPRDVVDLATGSGDVAFTLRETLGPRVAITGLDFCQPMLDQAEEKKKQRPNMENLRFAFGDCMDLPLDENSVDAITISFGLRNFEDRLRGMREMLRVLRPGGAAYILEFSQPSAWMKPFYYAYLKGLLPLMAASPPATATPTNTSATPSSNSPPAPSSPRNCARPVSAKFEPSPSPAASSPSTKRRKLSGRGILGAPRCVTAQDNEGDKSPYAATKAATLSC
jgi:demethylmenaquinone methyltransferase/2-methoxy-6-polyprenyl-1,4-benzoquinol methylase